MADVLVVSIDFWHPRALVVSSFVKNSSSSSYSFPFLLKIGLVVGYLLPVQLIIDEDAGSLHKKYFGTSIDDPIHFIGFLLVASSGVVTC